jgi:hypothetical protein
MRKPARSWAPLAVACLAAAATATSAVAAEGSTSAIARHPKLDRAATLWCIENPTAFKDAAQALKIKTGGGTIEGRIDRHGLTSVLEWAESGNARDISAFDKACKLAHSEVAKPTVDAHTAGEIANTASALKSIAAHDRGKTGISRDALVGLIGAIVGAVITAVLLSGFESVQAVSKRHRDEGERLIALDDAWRVALAAHVVNNRSADLALRAEVSGLRLRDALARWALGRQKQNAETAMTEIGNLLPPGRGQTKSPPHIGAVEDVKQVNTAAERITRLVDAVSVEISHLRRDGPAAQPAAPLSPGG